MKLTGQDAISYAEANNLTLNKYADPTEDAREGLTPAEALKVAREDPSLIWIDAAPPSAGLRLRPRLDPSERGEGEDRKCK